MRTVTRVALRSALGLVAGAVALGLWVFAAAPYSGRDMWLVGGSVGLLVTVVAAVGPDKLCELFRAAYTVRAKEE